MSEQASGAGEFAVLLVRLVGVGLWCVVYGGMGSGRVGTGYEVGGWGERHGALGGERALWLGCVAD